MSLESSTGGHMLVNLEKVGEWIDEESVHFARMENKRKHYKYREECLVK